MFKALGLFFEAISSFLVALASAGRATENAARVLEGRSEQYLAEEQHNLALKKAAFLAELEAKKAE